MNNEKTDWIMKRCNWKDSGRRAWNNHSGIRDTKRPAFLIDTDQFGHTCATSRLGNKEQRQQQNKKKN